MGKGNHSVNHIQKIKPQVEQVCQELHLQYATEENEGRMYINLTGGPANMPSQQGGAHHQQHGPQYPSGPYPQQGYPGQPSQGQQYPQGGYPGQQQHHGGGHGHGQNDPNAELEAAVKKFLPRIIRKLEGCCIVM